MPKADKPYPRRCCECGNVAVRSVTIAYDAKIKHDGKLHDFHIAELPVDRCDECKEEFFTNVTSDAKSDALRQHLGLATSERTALEEIAQQCAVYADGATIPPDVAIRLVRQILSRCKSALTTTPTT